MYKYLIEKGIAMKKLLVVGSSGLLGNRIIEIGRNRFETFGTYSKHKVGGDNSYRLDSVDRDAVFMLVGEISPDFVIDTHALTNVDYCETHNEEAWAVNVEGSRNIAEASEKINAKYVFLSSDNVFDGKKERYVETDKVNPLNYYGKTKAAVEEMLSSSDMDYLVIRTSVLYGVGGVGKASFATWLLSKLRNGEQVRVVTDQRNNPTFTDSLVEFMLRLCDTGKKGVFHVAGKNCVSRYEFSLKIADMFGLDRNLILPTTSSMLGQIAERPEAVDLSVEKAERISGLTVPDIGEGIGLFKRQFVIE